MGSGKSTQAEEKEDCAGVWQGSAVYDDCNICDGNNAALDCLGECNGFSDCSINLSFSYNEFDEDMVLLTNLNINEFNDNQIKC